MAVEFEPGKFDEFLNIFIGQLAGNVEYLVGERVGNGIRRQDASSAKDNFGGKA
jgi:tRNA U34 2-thiouridine synthase MnmA/TrmU